MAGQAGERSDRPRGRPGGTGGEREACDHGLPLVGASPCVCGGQMGRPASAAAVTTVAAATVFAAAAAGLPPHFGSVCGEGEVAHTPASPPSTPLSLFPPRPLAPSRRQVGGGGAGGRRQQGREGDCREGGTAATGGCRGGEGRCEGEGRWRRPWAPARPPPLPPRGWWDGSAAGVGLPWTLALRKRDGRCRRPAAAVTALPLARAQFCLLAPPAFLSSLLHHCPQSMRHVNGSLPNLTPFPRSSSLLYVYV